jgi:hypothetical protein
MTSRINLLPIVIEDIIWEYEGRFKMMRKTNITKRFLNDEIRKRRFRSQEENLTDSHYMTLIEDYYGKDGKSNNIHFTEWSQLPFFDKIVPENGIYHYQVLFHTEVNEYRKFIILPLDIDFSKKSDTDSFLSKYTGWICTERQRLELNEKHYASSWFDLEYWEESEQSIWWDIDYVTDNRNIFCHGYNYEKNLSLFVEF